MTRSSIRLACASAAVIAGLAVGGAAPTAQSPELPAPRGPYALGTTILHWVDASRSGTAPGHDREPRELMVQVWYPSAPSSAPFAPYVPEFDVIARYAKE